MIEALFKGKLDISGRIIYSNPDHFSGYCTQFKDTDVMVKITPIVKIPEKLRLYAYYESTIVPMTVKALTDDGWEMITESAADDYLKNALALGVVHNRKTGDKFNYVINKKQMTKERLTKFVNDCILLLRERHGVEVPDSQEYLQNKESGRNFKRIK